MESVAEKFLDLVVEAPVLRCWLAPDDLFDSFAPLLEPLQNMS